MDLSAYTKGKKKELLTQKRKAQQDIKELIEKIKNMDLEGYLRYLKKEDEEEENEEETEDVSIQTILELKKIQKRNKSIKYNLAF